MIRLGARGMLLMIGVLLASVLGTGMAAAAAPPRIPDQGLGNRGVDVKALQGLLIHHGATIRVDGIFAASTATAVRAFQSSRGLPVTGRADAATWAALLVRVETGTTGEAVRALQRQLNEKRDARLAVDGVFGTTTRAALVAFQRHMRISPTAIAGPVTWRALLAHFERPVFGSKVCDYQVGNGLADWGTAAAIGQLEAAAATVVGLGHGRIAVGDVGHEHGGDIRGHQSHEYGLDVDIRPIRRAGDQCRWGGSWRLSTYDRAATRDVIKAIRAAAPGQVKVIYFNDPVLIREGLTRRYTGHEDHLHVRYCERAHPVAAYAC